MDRTIGSYNLSGSGQFSPSWIHIGYAGTGSFTQSGGTIAGDIILLLGENAGASGTYSLSGTGRLSTTTEYFASGSFIQSGGTNAVNTLYVA